jgi:superfamily II DNA or RNA helicase
VAFTLSSGISLVWPHLEDLLNRGGQLRFLTGDYLNVTDPIALSKLLDLCGSRQLKIFETSPQLSFHPKVYIAHFKKGDGRAYVGSSNLSKTALKQGVEWNYGLVSSEAAGDFSLICHEFDELFNNQRSSVIDSDWIRSYEDRREEHPIRPPLEAPLETAESVPIPHSIQADALKSLEAYRAAGNRAGLVVLATGLGKTWLSAFDCVAARSQKILFVAHREEILSQAIATFRRILPEAHLGRFTGKEKDTKADVLFASIQTLGRLPHLRTFSRDAFDYIVVDEFHHAAARTYRNLINHFEPAFLLGLTATPERTDGADLLTLCGGNIVFRCDMFEGIEKELLSPFRYYGVPDEVDYENIPWRSSKFDPQSLDAAVATEARAQNAYEQWLEKGGQRTLAFCCSVLHANYSADYFRSKGVDVAVVHSGADSDPRASSLEALERGEIQILCTVDMFNEGVDVPSIDTVLMLRPTESAILWAQQVGRGLRRAEGKEKLTIIDYIGNHRIFLTKPRTLMGFGPSDQDARIALAAIRDQSFHLPLGCEITYDLEALDILEGLLRPPSRGSEILKAYYCDFRDRIGIRPLALETFNEGYNPKKTGSDRWMLFVREMGDLSGDLLEAYQENQHFLDAIEATPMSKSFKMLVLLAALNEDAFPGSIHVNRLAEAVRHIAIRTQGLRDEFGSAIEDSEALIRLLEKNPIEAWVGGKGMGGQQYFKYKDGVFSSEFTTTASLRQSLQDLTRELAEWRLADYQSKKPDESREESFECKVFHSSGQPILKLPDREKIPNLPSDWVNVQVDNKQYEAKFAKIAINVFR